MYKNELKNNNAILFY